MATSHQPEHKIVPFAGKPDAVTVTTRSHRPHCYSAPRSKASSASSAQCDLSASQLWFALVVAVSAPALAPAARPSHP